MKGVGMRRRAFFALVTVVFVIVSMVTTATSNAASSTTPFTAAGTVVNAHAAIDPTPFEGQNAAFVLDNLTELSASADPYVDNQIKVNVTPTTKYYKLNQTSGTYQTSTYDGTVVQGQQLRTYGRFAQNPSGGQTFIAVYVWNPPTT